MRKTGTFLSGLGLIVLVAMTPASADDPEIVLTIEMQEEVTMKDDDGNIQVVRRKADRTEPGNVLLYTLRYTNKGDSPAMNARVDDAIPDGTVLLPGSVKGENTLISFSVDGGKSYGSFPVSIQVPGPDGKPVIKKASAEQYTHIRWIANAPLKPGESRVATFKVLVQ